MGFLGLPEYEGPVDSWRDGKERGDLVIGREGSAKLEVDLSTPSAHTREPQPAEIDTSSRPGLFGRIGEMLAGPREPERDVEAEL